jgi:hypothetical protein
MNKAFFGKGSIGIVGIGMLAASLAVGCGGADTGQTTAGPSNAGGTSSNQQAMITLTSAVPDGNCTSNLTFDITSGNSQNIQFIAMDKSDLQNATMQLQDIDSQNHVHDSNTTAQQADSSLQALIDQFTQSKNSATLDVTTKNDSTANHTTNATLSDIENVQTSVDNNTQFSQTNQSDVNSLSSGSSDQTGSASADAKNAAKTVASANATGDSLQSASNNQFAKLANLFSQNSTAMGGAASTSFLNQMLNAVNKADSSSLATNKTDNNSLNTSDVSSHANQDSKFTNHNEFLNTADNSQQNATVLNVHNTATTNSQKNLQTTASTGDNATNNNDSTTKSDNSAESSSGNHQTQDNKVSSTSNTMVFNNLDQINSNHFLLNVTATATKDSAITQIFVGAANTIQKQQQFQIGFPGCGN